MAPPFAFPAPVLSVAADVVRELEGGEALTGLWTLFTKCKASLEDGHRLENISWRLWHRELAATTATPGTGTGTRPGRISESEHDGNRLDVPSTHVALPVSTTAGFGKIIVDMLPHALPHPPDTHSQCHLPTPAASEVHLMPPLPKLVIVHPTPGPTPPASPAPTTLSPKFTIHADCNTTESSEEDSSARGSDPATESAAASTMHGPAPPPPPPTKSPPQPPAMKKAHSTPSPSTADTRARPRVPGKRTSASTSTITSTSTSTNKSKRSSSRSSSRSQSRGRGRADGPGPVLAGLVMTSVFAATANGASGKRTAPSGLGAPGTGTAARGRALGLRKSASLGGRAGSGARAARTQVQVQEEKRPTFNIGSHSDGSASASVSASGSGTKSVESGRAQGQGQGHKQKLGQGLIPAPAPATALPLPDPATVLPRQQPPRRTIVLATSESEDDDDYETETDVSESEDCGGRGGGGGAARRVEEEEEGDTADWSSEDMSADDVEFVRQSNGKAQGQRGQRWNNNNNNGSGAHANHSTHTHTSTRPRPPPAPAPQHPHQHQHPHPPTSRAQSRRTHAANAQHIVEQAALEAARIREMFTKKPVPSSEDLARQQRTRSVGLLTQLMHPDLGGFVPGPGRGGIGASVSSGDVRGVGVNEMGVNGNGMGRERERAALGQGQAGSTATATATVRPLPQRRASAGPVPGINLRKGAAAGPVASQVQVGSVSRETNLESAVAVAGVVGGDCAGGGGYRSKRRLPDLEMEDTETESEGDGGNEMLVSRSVAQEKLRALVARKGIGRVRRDGEEDGDGRKRAPTTPTTTRAGRRTTSLGECDLGRGDVPSKPTPTPTPTPAPIPLGHPYNLPPAAPPSTPRTTRRLMLQTEMSESLRRNLLWERQVSKVNLVVRRSSSGGGGGGKVLGAAPLKPLTALPSMVQLMPKQPGEGSGSGSGSGRNTPLREREGEGEGERHARSGEERDREERKKRALARNRSWANEFHYTGW